MTAEAPPVILDTLLPLDRMRRELAGGAEAYRSATPFPHAVFDDFFDPEALAPVLAEFPGPDAIRWRRFHTSRETKLANADETAMGPWTRALVHQLNSAPFLLWLSELTGIHGLIADPYLEGGGHHQTLPGGRLGLHVDFNRHRHLGLDRRLNLLVYLNRDWPEAYGGHLELWDRDVQRCHRKVLPVWNRVALFSTTDFSYHGHPEPLACPPDRTRKSIALYYYTNGRPADEVSSGHPTQFVARPGERFRYHRSALLRSLVPPIVIDGAQRLLQRLRQG